MEQYPCRGRSSYGQQVGPADDGIRRPNSKVAVFSGSPGSSVSISTYSDITSTEHSGSDAEGYAGSMSSYEEALSAMSSSSSSLSGQEESHASRRGKQRASRPSTTHPARATRRPAKRQNHPRTVHHGMGEAAEESSDLDSFSGADLAERHGGFSCFQSGSSFSDCSASDDDTLPCPVRRHGGRARPYGITPSLGQKKPRIYKNQESSSSAGTFIDTTLHFPTTTYNKMNKPLLRAMGCQQQQKLSARKHSLMGSSKVSDPADFNTTPLYFISSDIMGCILSYLNPAENHAVLTIPLSKTFKAYFSDSNDIWKMLCLSPPFSARFKDTVVESSSEDSDVCFFSNGSHAESSHLSGRFKALYKSFVTCMKYLEKIKAVAVSGSTVQNKRTALLFPAEDLPRMTSLPTSLNAFMASAGRVVRRMDGIQSITPCEASLQARENCEGAADRRKRSHQDLSNAPLEELNHKKKPIYAHSKLTQSLLGPARKSSSPAPGPLDLPYSCAIYAIVNWMVAFLDVPGIQMQCLKTLPYILEDERQRTTAQLAGLSGMVLRAMLTFPDNVELHIAAFHTLVLLARPLGGKEGMLFHRTMGDSSRPQTYGIFDYPGSQAAPAITDNGTAVVLESMRRFQENEILQAMGCWSMVNIALIPSQKSLLVKLGGIRATANAMMKHPFSSEVQFRALFALINLVIPCEDDGGTANSTSLRRHTTEKGLLDENVKEIAYLIVLAMNNFCSNEAILNRACLVLHNLSLRPEYHATLLRTPNCYQMLDWTMKNYRHDKVIEQSAGGTLQRLQSTLSADEESRLKLQQA